MNTKRILPFLALMITVAGPFAYADGGNDNKDKDKDASASNSQPAAQSYAQSESTNNQQSGCPVAQDPKQDKKKTNSAPSDQEKEFERVLMGIYG
jgi:hypothetical protein